jgi:hypothetical protein
MKFQKEMPIIWAIKMAPLKCGKVGDLKWHGSPYLTITFVITIKDIPEYIPRRRWGKAGEVWQKSIFTRKVSNK